MFTPHIKISEINYNPATVYTSPTSKNDLKGSPHSANTKLGLHTERVPSLLTTVTVPLFLIPSECQEL